MTTYVFAASLTILRIAASPDCEARAARVTTATFIPEIVIDTAIEYICIIRELSPIASVPASLVSIMR